VNSTSTIELCDSGRLSYTPATGSWHTNQEKKEDKVSGLLQLAKIAGLCVPLSFSSFTAISDPWLVEQIGREAVVTISNYSTKLILSTDQLGWSTEQVIETRMRLRTFEEDWDAPGMEGYDVM
jgi:hypothetical protein